MESDSKVIKTQGKELLEERHGIRVLHLRCRRHARRLQGDKNVSHTT